MMPVETEDEETQIARLHAERAQIWPDVKKFFEKNSAHIEVLRRFDNEMNLERTYFPILPFCHAITKDTKTLFNLGVNRISGKAKVSSLLQESEDLIGFIKHEYQMKILFSKVKVISMLANNIMLWRDTSFFLVIIINFLILINTESDGNPDLENPLSRAVFGIGIVVVLFSVVIVSYTLMKNAPGLIKKAWAGVEADKLNIFKYILRLIKMVLYLIGDPLVFYYSIYGVTAIIGLTAKYFFFAFHLFDVVVRFPTLQNVLKSIYLPRKELFLTYLLYQMMNVFFTMLSYYWLHSHYQGWCEDLWACYLTVFDKSFKYDGAIGGFLMHTELPQSGRLIFDGVYFLLVHTVLLNIVTGIISDTFGQLRDEEKEFAEDTQNKCFICNNDKELIDKATEGVNGFLIHIKKDHYLWNYLFYIAYLKEKEKTEYTGLESYIAECVEKEDISWFPTERAFILEKHRERSDEGLERKLKEIAKKQELMLKSGKHMEAELKTLDDKIKAVLKKRKSLSKQTSMKSAKSGASSNNLY